MIYFASVFGIYVAHKFYMITTTENNSNNVMMNCIFQMSADTRADTRWQIEFMMSTIEWCKLSCLKKKLLLIESKSSILLWGGFHFIYLLVCSPIWGSFSRSVEKPLDTESFSENKLWDHLCWKSHLFWSGFVIRKAKHRT